MKIQELKKILLLYKWLIIYFFVDTIFNIIPQYSEEQKHKAISLLVQQKSTYEVANITRINVTTIKRW